MPTTIHPFPELRAYAESEARQAYDAFCRCAEEQPYHRGTGHRRKMAFVWGDDQGIREWWIEAHLTLLCDLTRRMHAAIGDILADYLRALEAE